MNKNNLNIISTYGLETMFTSVLYYLFPFVLMNALGEIEQKSDFFKKKFISIYIQFE